MRVSLCVTLVFAFSSSLAFAAGEIHMATSEDLNAFDAQIESNVPGFAPSVQRSGVGQEVTAEARRMREDAQAGASAGAQARKHVRQHGTPANAMGASGEISSGKASGGKADASVTQVRRGQGSGANSRK